MHTDVDLIPTKCAVLQQKVYIGNVLRKGTLGVMATAFYHTFSFLNQKYIVMQFLPYRR